MAAFNRTVPDRRALRFERIDDALEEAERLLRAEREGRLRPGGNWTLGQALGHLATWANFALDGYPPEIRPPWPVRAVLRLVRGRIIEGGMTPGMRLRGVPGGTVGTEVMSVDDGMVRFRAAFERLGSTAPTIVNPVFGRLTHAQWIALNLRHAELHLGFFDAREPGDRVPLP